jgi:hypothetical protein
VPDVCVIQNGSCTASSNVFVNGKGSVVSASRSSSNEGSSKIVMDLCFVNASTRGSIACSCGRIHTSHLAAFRTAKAPSTLFFGDKNRACKKKGELVFHFLGFGVLCNLPRN